MKREVDERRIYKVNSKPVRPGPILYWMSRDQRVADNWSLLYAQQLARAVGRELIVAFCHSPGSSPISLRQLDFMIQGLKSSEKTLHDLHIPFQLLPGEPESELPALAHELEAGAVIADFNPLRKTQDLLHRIAERAPYALQEVDSHNIVPCRHVSGKQEYAAYTLRPKIEKLLPEFLTDFPGIEKQESEKPSVQSDWETFTVSFLADRSVQPVENVRPGERAAASVLKEFLEKGLASYAADRNNPVKNAQSGLSPYLHFGQISAQRIALEVHKHAGHSESREAFLEELIVRKELSDNFCLHNREYDTVDGFPDWAKKTQREHKDDPREYLYTLEQFDEAETHDALWNAAQSEMVNRGKMHGYMRMYWAKKILEWTRTPSEAMAIAIYLNDKYELDGCDPNGYAGIAWSIGGVHDRAWFERPLFGKIRYLNANGCRSKFNTKRYIDMHLSGEGGIRTLGTP
ncbi:MAG: deoxyribodipyrimidine photo-lyase [Balneolaceae bacterium]